MVGDGRRMGLCINFYLDEGGGAYLKKVAWRRTAIDAFVAREKRRRWEGYDYYAN